ncbi:GNAT family N-acetyltransferase [Pseudaminobacter soli (ex Li et al. 2025)]|uniref:GNAT family N-acetyltransferase n=1 Tax=Pseudaminobacter soli (ex Li et al. 2025) TaxID=1295366 RepID=A0A2P7RVX2_9HYPH|nr:GNAT family N-acetyltransferase [Mesorhizobium soli]PSJ54370.1 GNAT family N-acetyltransferase [Mesorhizobium soli]
MAENVMRVRVRIADGDDIPGIEALLSRSYPILMAQAYTPQVLALALALVARENPALIGSGTLYVAEDAGTVVGCGGWTFDAPGSGMIVDGLAHNRRFAVDPERAGRGIGRAIFERSARDAVEAGAARIRALSSLNAEPFYERMGLRRLDLIRVPIEAGVEFPLVLMEGVLLPPPTCS